MSLEINVMDLVTPHYPQSWVWAWSKNWCQDSFCYGKIQMRVCGDTKKVAKRHVLGTCAANFRAKDRSFMIRVAIIEDDPLVHTSLNDAIAQDDAIHAVGLASSLADGGALVSKGGYDVLICDLGLPDGDGTMLVSRSAALHPDADVLVLTMFADHHKVFAAIKAGARGYLLMDQITTDCIAAIRQVREGGSPISPIIARLLLVELGQKHQSALPPPSHASTAVTPQQFSAETSALLSAREVETLHLLARGFTYAVQPAPGLNPD
jgi:DNA-binding NarL/FixJ family response regulator